MLNLLEKPKPVQPQKTGHFQAEPNSNRDSATGYVEPDLLPPEWTVGGLFHVGSQVPPFLALGHSLLLSPQPLGMQKPGRDSFPSLSLPGGVETPWDPDTERVQAAQSGTANAELLSSPPDAS